ncbi:hypothetical protein LCGC14_2532080 [marine sediment metagenome]|uniref:HNH nuclease domain-containing protein n=1 Tax=marine sediment metagenome TaxID=412755 RepID=A0A0F9ATQ0_9ZZZZ
MANNYPIRTCQYCKKSFKTKPQIHQPFCSTICSFWDKVEVTSLDECWIWQAKGRSRGYGQLWVKDKQRQLRAHRISWEFRYGKIPNGLYVLHDCDNRLCVNPRHLFLGTHLDNIKDMVNKKRHTIGEKNPNSKLSNENVRIIKQRLNLGHSSPNIAKDFDVSRWAVCLIKTGKRWKHI